MASGACAALAQDQDLRTVEGVVVFARGGDRFAFIRMADGRAARLWLVPGNRVWFGDVVAATGRVSQEKPTFRIEDCTVKKVSSGAPLPENVETTVAGLMTPPGPGRRDFFGVPIETTVRVVDVNRRRTQVQLLVTDIKSPGPSMVASFALDENKPVDPDLRRGAVVRLAGVPSMDYRTGEDGTPAEVINLTLNLPGPWSVKILNPAPWWTPARIWTAAGLAAFVVTALVAWVAVLGIAVRRKAAELARTMRLQHAERLEADAARRERLRLAHDLHDGFQQLLTGAMFQLNAGMNILEADHDEPGALAHLESALLALQHTQTGLRTVLWTMREESEGPGSLVELFRYAAGRMPHWKNAVFFSQTGETHPLARKVTGSLLMILQEAVGNAFRHGKASRVDVSVAYGEESLVLEIANNGLPFDPAAASGPAEGHFGLESMRQRAAELGGTLEIESSGRVVISVSIPYAKEQIS